MSHGSEKRVRSKHLTIRLSPEERDEIDGDAQRAGLTAGSYARGVLLDAPTPRQVRRPPVDRREVARLIGQLGYVGNNLNQIARAINSGDEADDQALSQALDDLHEVRDAALRALGREP
jgi:Bacterial mobilisation protein (MobC)